MEQIIQRYIPKIPVTIVLALMANAPPDANRFRVMILLRIVSCVMLITSSEPLFQHQRGPKKDGAEAVRMRESTREREQERERAREREREREMDIGERKT